MWHGWSGGWWRGFLVGFGVLLAAATAPAQEPPLRGGTFDLTFARGYSISYNTTGTEGVRTVDGFHLLPHVGYVVNDPVGPVPIRGSFQLLAEPTLIHLDGKDESSTVFGLAALGRWVFATGPFLRPFVEAGVGVLGGKTEFRQTSCDVNFILQGGVGLLFFLGENAAVTTSYRFHHISNAGTCDQNLGLNSSLFMLGVSYFFP